MSEGSTDALRMDDVPRLEGGTLVLAFNGWMDGGDVSTGTVRRLVENNTITLPGAGTLENKIHELVRGWANMTDTNARGGEQAQKPHRLEEIEGEGLSVQTMLDGWFWHDQCP